MFSLLYDCIQFVGVLALLPKLIGRWVFKKDSSLLAYLGFCLPKAKSSKGLCFMFYAVSVGEVKAAASLYIKMKEACPTATFSVSCRTKTGLEEAKRSLPLADSYFLLPFDFSWICKRLLNRLRPDAIFIMEGDLWYNFLKAARVRGSLVCLVSGKISARSYKRFSYFPFLSKKLFNLFTLICAQNKVFAERFISLGAKAESVVVTGKIKLAAQNERVPQDSLDLLQEKLGIRETDFIVVLGSTHAPEEEKMVEIFKELSALYPQIKFLIVPRHPERFPEVKNILSSSKIPFISFSDLERNAAGEKIFLVDKMGLLANLYQIADLAIVGGSFAPFLKGHNILEPIQKGTPVFFGPYMSDQRDLVDLILSHKAGLQIDLFSLKSTIELCINDPLFLSCLIKHGVELREEIKGAVSCTWLPILQHIKSAI